MPTNKGIQYQLNHSESLLELLQKITSKERVNQSNRNVRGEKNSIECDDTSLKSTDFQKTD